VPPSYTEADQPLQDHNLSAAENKCQFVREPLFFSHDCLPIFFLFRFVYQFDRLPAISVARFSLSQYAVEHSGRAEFWTSRYGWAQDVLGKSVRISGVSLTIIDVTRRGLRGISPGFHEGIFTWLWLGRSHCLKRGCLV
jgi:hypothetical protein